MDKLTQIREKLSKSLPFGIKNISRDSEDAVAKQQEFSIPEKLNYTLEKIELFFKCAAVFAIIASLGIKAHEAQLEEPKRITVEALEAQLHQVGMGIPNDVIEKLNDILRDKTGEFTLAPLEIESLSLWAERFSLAYKALQITDGDDHVLPIEVKQTPEGTRGFVLCVGEEETEVQIEESISFQEEAIHYLAHEIAHKETEICAISAQDYRTFDEFAIALWSDEHQETEAQLLALESLSYIYATEANEDIKTLAKEAFYLQLEYIVHAAQMYVTLAQDPIKNDGTEPLSDAYVYGYLPLAELYQAFSVQEIYFSVLTEGENNSPRIQHIALNYTKQLLLDEGISFG